MGHQRCFLEIIMRIKILIAAVFSLGFAYAKESPAPIDNESVPAAEVVREMNFARENPKLYAEFAAAARPLHMIEQGRAVDEAVRFLKKARPLPPLTISTGMCRAAADHCAEQVDGRLGHDGNDHSNP